MNMGFDELTRKTFEISYSEDHREMLKEEKRKSSISDEMVFDIIENEEALPLAPKGPGLVFKIEKGSQTFCIRGLSTDCIEQSLLDIESGELKSRSKLKFQGEEDFDYLNFFELSSMELSEKIQSGLFNRRFPLDENLLCNLSDPSFSWWLEDCENGFEVFFQSYRALEQNHFHKLGPIGDQAFAASFFRNSEQILRKFFAINEFSCDEKSLRIIPCDPENLNYKQLLNVFYGGEDSDFLQTFSANKKELSFFDYLEELSSTRRLWLNIEEILEDL